MSGLDIIKPGMGRRILIYQDGNTGDIVRSTMLADRWSAKYIDSRKADQLRGPDDYHTLENIYWFVKKNIRYKIDPNGRQDIRLPGYLFDSGEGDCKSFSVAIAALCRALSIPCKYRFVRQSGQPNFHHVYAVATTTDRSARGDVLLDAVHRKFDAEPAYARRLDLKPGQRVPDGIGGMASTNAWIIILIIIGFFAYKD